ncbi:superoxide dismutase [Candidatus Woesearchaeota archaeon]|nr:superoxide dismutase [Candidatus Woesearchaeota archaeon]
MAELPTLPYEYDALEPFIDKQTMEIHHSKHHQGYVNKYNVALAGRDELLDLPVEKVLSDLSIVPKELQQKVINFGGGVANHSLFFFSLSIDKSKPEGKLLDAIVDAFGSFENFVEEFSEQAKGFFGSGWTWLVKDGGNVKIVSLPNQDSPLSKGMTPLLNLDLWEHAYYLKYQNRRAEYVDNFWKVIDWTVVAQRFSD